MFEALLKDLALASLDGKIKNGDKFTIEGLEVKKDGTLMRRRCKPGKETVFTANISEIEFSLEINK